MRVVLCATSELFLDHLHHLTSSMGSPFLLDSASAILYAVLLGLIGIFIFWCLANLKGRCVPRQDADQIERNDGDSKLKDRVYSNPGGDDAVKDIFLSHSGFQKPFVERLFDELERTNHTVFFDQHSFIPKGSLFPTRIKQAARGCKLGVVVLSEEFLTSKWPMLELEIMVSQDRMLFSQRRGLKDIHVLPLFFGLEPKDLKSPNKLEKWRGEWIKLVGADQAKQWEQAVHDLGAFNGMVYKKESSEGAYIKNVVKRICNVLPFHVPYDCSSIQGRSQLAEEIVSKFEHLDASRARMVGLYGVGGVGKTTLCKVMANHYSAEFCGRSFLLEFPSPSSGDMPTVVSKCKKFLGKLIDARKKDLLSDIDDFDQVVQLMKNRVGSHDVFLAVDNVWEQFLEEAKRVLGVGFSANSKVLVMSRSEEVLKDLLGGPVNNVIVDPLPGLELKEAFHIFQASFEQDLLGSLQVSSKQMNEVLGRCRFNGSYHALALKALAKYVKRACKSANSKERIKRELSGILKEIISNKNLSEVDKVIGLSYDSLPMAKKHLFLDIAVCLSEFRQDARFFKVQEWVSLLYWQSPRSQTTKLMIDLSFDGLIEIEERRDGQKAVGLHDLYYEFALKKIAESPRFWVRGITKESKVELVKSEELAIVILGDGQLGPSLFEKLQQCACPKLRLLKATHLETKRGICINSMPSLSVLILDDINLMESECQNTTTSSGSHSEQDSAGSQQIVLHELVELQKLEVSNIEFVEELAGLDALSNLRSLEVCTCRWLRSLDGLSGLVQLQSLLVNDCERLGSLPDMRHLTCLESLRLSYMEAMEEVGRLPSKLKEASVRQCEALKRMPDVSGLTQLKSLALANNDAMEEVGGDYFCSSLTRVTIVNCLSLRRCPRLNDQCKHLETDCAPLTCSSVSRMLNFPKDLQGLYVADKPSLIRKIDVGSLTNLQDLTLKDCGALRKVVGLTTHRSLFHLSIKRCPHLVDLSIKQCPRLKRLSVGCPNLKKILVEDCEALEELLWDSEGLPSLQEVRVQGPNSLRQGHVSLAIVPVIQM